MLGTHRSLSGIHNLIKTCGQQRFDVHGEVLERRPGSRQSSKNNKALAIMGVLRLRKTGMNSRPSRARAALPAGLVSTAGAPLEWEDLGNSTRGQGHLPQTGLLQIPSSSVGELGAGSRPSGPAGQLLHPEQPPVQCHPHCPAPVPCVPQLLFTPSVSPSCCSRRPTPG